MGVAPGIPDSFEGFPKTRAALEYARALHAGQVRKVDGAPFFLHPREVAWLLYEAGAPDALIAAGALHDVIEKTPALASDLRARFGTRVATLVAAVSEDERISGYAARKAALRRQVADGGEEALMLFAADKISKTRELGLEDRATPSGPEAPDRESATRRRRLAHYERCLALLQERLTDTPLVRRLQAELELIARSNCRPRSVPTS
jgi:HD domain-containing protein